MTNNIHAGMIVSNGVPMSQGCASEDYVMLLSAGETFGRPPITTP